VKSTYADVDVSEFECLEPECDYEHVTEGMSGPSTAAASELLGATEVTSVYSRGYFLTMPVFDEVAELRTVDHRSLRKLRVPSHRYIR
jgi:hypothetical protein